MSCNRFALLAIPLVLCSAVALAQGKVIEATTADGEKVRLLPNGRWEFIDTGKAAAAKKIADQFPENQPRPADAQGGWGGLGRAVLPGDKDYNRGSLNPKATR